MSSRKITLPIADDFVEERAGSLVSKCNFTIGNFQTREFSQICSGGELERQWAILLCSSSVGPNHLILKIKIPKASRSPAQKRT